MQTLAHFLSINQIVLEPRVLSPQSGERNDSHDMTIPTVKKASKIILNHEMVRS